MYAYLITDNSFGVAWKIDNDVSEFLLETGDVLRVLTKYLRFI